MFWWELDEDVWVLLGKFNLFWASIFSITFLITNQAVPSRTFLVLENGVLAGLFGSIQTCCWLST